ncbi:MAG: hypothetical protein LBB50_06080, partial [Oscillospiraceae bacterium]|nr:hypothetical protein [Oscillospiraceae bacterium]
EKIIAPEVSYTTKYLSYLDYFELNSQDAHKPSPKVFYQAGANWFFGPLAALFGSIASIFGPSKYDAAFDVTQWFGDTFNFILK